MPARERYYPGTQWKIKSHKEVPECYWGLNVTLLTELQQDESEDTENPGDLYTWAYISTSSPFNDLIKIEDVFWLE